MTVGQAALIRPIHECAQNDTDPHEHGGIAWSADRPLTAPAAAFRDFALTYAGRLPETEAG
ncbi:MAG TPA: hypothetical protein VF223_12395 [Trebonia sp.]